MKLLNRFLLALLCVIVFAIGLFAILTAIGFPVRLETIQSALAQLENPLVALCVSLISLFVIALACWLFLVSIGVVSREPRNVPIHKGESGSSYMTVHALTSMIDKFIRANLSISDAKVFVKTNGNAAKIKIRAAAKEDTSIPLMTEELQESIKAYVETYAGVTIEQVEIIVDQTKNTQTLSRVS